MIGELKKNLENIQNNINQELSKNHDLSEPRLIAVSKKQSVEKIKMMNDLGVKDFAENYLQEALLKMEQLKDRAIHWHFIGKLQSKKIKDIVGHFELIHAVSRLSEVQKISQIAIDRNITQNILIQINVANEETKQGFSWDEIDGQCSQILDFKNINLMGMMVFPPLSNDEVDTLHWFSLSQQIFQKLKTQIGPQFKHLSMGTSADYHLALRQGSTDLRLGECLMGLRSEGK